MSLGIATLGSYGNLNGMTDIGFQANQDAPWRCPCGEIVPFKLAGGHRKGCNKAHPELKKIRGHLVNPPPIDNIPSESYDSSQGESSDDETIPESSHGNSASGQALHSQPWDYDQGPHEDDPEEVADRLLETEFGGIHQNGNGHGDGLNLEGKDWRLEPPSGDPNVSTGRETVEVPYAIRVIYDYLRDKKGYRVGDGSFAAFVQDMLLDHIEHCLDQHLVVVDGWELRNDGSRLRVE